MSWQMRALLQRLLTVAVVSLTPRGCSWLVFEVRGRPLVLTYYAIAAERSVAAASTVVLRPAGPSAWSVLRGSYERPSGVELLLCTVAEVRWSCFFTTWTIGIKSWFGRTVVNLSRFSSKQQRAVLHARSLRARPAKSRFSESSRLVRWCNAAFCPGEFGTGYKTGSAGQRWPVSLLIHNFSFLKPMCLVCCDDTMRKVSLFSLSVPQHRAGM